MRDRIREVIQQSARLSTDAAALGDDADLYKAGLTSHATVNLMLALEDEFAVEFPEALLQRKTFESIASIETALRTIHAQSGAA